MISIAMCTYNGEKFVLEQLESFVHQTVLPDEIVIFDDNSTDNTVDIVRKFKDNAPFDVRIFCNSSSVGVVHNFALAIEACNGEYIFLSDQDDVWLPDKIEITMNKMLYIEANLGDEHPICVHTDLKVVNEELNIMSNSFFKYQGVYHLYKKREQIKVLPVQNFVVGCTVLINKAMKDAALPFPENVVMHDHWLSLIAACAGTLEFIDVPTINYRQHTSNTVGAHKLVSFSNFQYLVDKDRIRKNILAKYYQLLDFIKFQNGKYVPINSELSLFRQYIDSGDVNKALGVHFCKEGFIKNLLFRVFLKIYRNYFIKKLAIGE